MLNTEALLDGVLLLLNWKIYVFILLGVIYGIVMGSIPGISALLSIGLILPFTMYMEPIEAIVLLSAIYTSAVYGGGITAVLFNMPGAPGAVASTLDGYPLTRDGRANYALGIGLASSFVGLMVSYIAIFFFMRPIGVFVLKLGPPEMLMIVVIALTIIGLVGGNFLKSLAGGCFGLLLGTIGAGPLGMARGTFGLFELYEGIPVIPTVIGLFAVSELLFMVREKSLVKITEEEKNANKKSPREFLMEILSGFTEVWKDKAIAIKSSVIGLVVGLLPGAGSSIAALVSYSQTQQSVKDSSKFGKGDPRGVVAAESANNASEAGAMATTLAFGIPGGGAAAVLMAAFLMHGMFPGPYLVRDSMDFVYAFVISNFIQGIFLIFVGIVFIYYVARVVHVPVRILIPAIFIIITIGTFSLRRTMVDPFFTLIFGILGYVLRKLEYPVVSVVLGIFLGSMVESQLIRTYRLFSGRWHLLFARPLFLALFLVVILVIGFTLRKNSKNKKTTVDLGV